MLALDCMGVGRGKIWPASTCCALVAQDELAQRAQQRLQLVRLRPEPLHALCVQLGTTLQSGGCYAGASGKHLSR